MDSETVQSRKILGWNSATVGLLLMTFPLFFLGNTVLASNPTATYYDVLFDAIVSALAAAVLVLCGSSRIVGTVDGIQVINLFFCVELPVKNIAKIRSSRGLVFLTADGQSIPCFAYGQSLIGNLFGYRRARLAEQRCDAWVQARRLDNVSSCRPRTKRLRKAVIWAPLVLVTVYLAEAFIVHKFIA
jgi:hypothetical protein